MATTAYMMDNDDYFPRSTHSALASGVLQWGYAIVPYLGQGEYQGPGADWDSVFNKVYRCRADLRRDCWSYGKNVWFELTSGEIGELEGIAEGPTYTKSSDVVHPSTTILYGELGSGSMGDHIMAFMWYLGGHTGRWMQQGTGPSATMPSSMAMPSRRSSSLHSI